MDEDQITEPSDRRALPFAEQLVLWALRLSVVGLKTGAPTDHPVLLAFRKVGAEAAAERIGPLTRIIGFGAERRVQIGVPCAFTVTEDERRILDLVAIGQSGVAGALMLRGMLSPAACRAAGGLCAELGGMLAEAGVMLQHPAPAPRPLRMPANQASFGLVRAALP
ncbi:hypothetical protein KXR53_05070 [Inquilinus limosus]|uniref:hypothetical protein n=1 Tax=Inquilinus limosus TaxID=171674 RepID=UPI003F18C555